MSGGKKSQQSCPRQKGTIAVVFTRLIGPYPLTVAP